MLRRQIGGIDSEMTRTLLTHVGQNSPLLKALTPDESNQLLQSLRQGIEEQLTSQREVVLREFSLDNGEECAASLDSGNPRHE